MAYPILAPNSTWYKSSTARSTITQINIVNSYTPTGSENESWNADVGNTGSIKCYRTGTVITMAGNGSGKIAMNADSSYMFSSTSSSNRLTSLLTINGLSFLDASGVTNMTAVFYGCFKMTTIDLSNWSANNVTSTTAMFARCSSLVNVEVSSLVGASVTQANSMFQSCASLNSINVSSWNTSGIVNFRQMFLECSSLTTLDVSNWNTSNATNMSDMFKDCSSLTTLDVSNWDVSKVTAMQYMFDNCASLTIINVSNWDVSKVTNMSYMFQECTALTTLNVSNWDVSEVTTMNHMFNGCTSLTSLDVSNWDVSKVTTMHAMFQQGDYGTVAAPLTELDVSNWDTSSCTDMGWMFYGLRNVKTLDVSKWDVSKVECLHHFAAHAYIELIGVENWEVSNCRAFNATFYSCQNTSLDLSGWDVSKGVTFSQMFEGSGSLVEIKGLENWNTSNGGSFSQMFLNCPSLKKLDLSSFDTRNASTNWTDEWRDNTEHGSMHDMFGNLTSLEKITLGENFSFNGDGTATPAVLPTPDATYISGADGNWYDEDGVAYAVTAIPTGAGTYYAAVNLIDGTYFIKRRTLVGIADAVREKTSLTEKMTPDEIIINIRGISGGQTSEDLTDVLDTQEAKLNELLTILDGKATGGGGVLSGYTLCDYIQFTGKQYIDTGIKGNQNTQICASFVWENTTQCHLYGCTSTNNTASITAYMGGAWRFGNKSSNKTLSSKSVLLPYSSLVNKTTIGILGSATAISSVNDFETVGTLLVGGARTSDGSLPTSGFMGKVFHFRLWENDEQVLNLVPVVSDDGVYRFFDTISKTFFDSVSDTPLNGGNL